MTKFDHKSQLPILFAKSGLSILPTSRGTYTIGTFEAFSEFRESFVGEITPIRFPPFLESIDYKNINSEATAINCAFISDILNDFILKGEEGDLLPTVSGRMGSSSFDFEINSSRGRFRIDVQNAQVEIDGGYEEQNSLTLIEAKNHISSDFLVRQLFYPLRLWADKVTKKVRPVFLTYSNRVFHLREYEFENLDYYNSLKLISQKKYVLKNDDFSFNLKIIDEIVNNTEILREPEIPFPQADSFERVINLCELLVRSDYFSKEEITENFDFDSRQTDYYSNACRYLGLLEFSKDPVSKQSICILSKKGKKNFSLNLFQRQKQFVKIIVEHEPFKRALQIYLEEAKTPSKEQIVEIMKQSNLYNMDADSTYERRSSTVSGWINWIISQIEE